MLIFWRVLIFCGVKIHVDQFLEWNVELVKRDQPSKVWGFPSSQVTVVV